MIDDDYDNDDNKNNIYDNRNRYNDNNDINHVLIIILSQHSLH